MRYDPHMKGVRRTGASFVGMVFGISILFVSPVAALASPQDEVAPNADGFLAFNVGVEIYDQAVWQYKEQGQCDIYSGTGQHTISAEAKPADSSAWEAWLPVKRTKKGYAPVRPKTGYLILGNEAGIRQRTAAASYNLNSTRSIEPTSNTGDCAPIICPDCSPSTPPQEQCGTKTGSVEIEIHGSIVAADGKRASLVFGDSEWTPENPFQTATTYCEEGGFWHWQTGWPGFETIDNGPYMRIDTSKLLGFFRKLDPQQRLRCNVFVSLPKYCSKASYTRIAKTVQREDINEPGKRDFKEQTSSLFVTFKFGSFAKFRKNGDLCFPRLGKKC